MTILIAHRGLTIGPNKLLENSPTSILNSRNLGYDVEIDVWKTQSGWFLGHDAPQYQTSIDWLRNINQKNYLDSHHAWIHAKNIEALYELRRIRWEGHLFYHQNDDVVITNTGYLWTFPGKQLTSLSVCVMPEAINSVNICHLSNVYGICSDYVHDIRSNLEY